MTTDELKKEAEKKAGIYFDSLDYDHGDVSDTPFSGYDVFVAYEKGALDFAEPREKRIAELINLIHAERKRQEQCDDIRLKKIAELEKENTELKGLKDVATLIRANNDTVTTLMQLNNMLVSKNQQLNKAKELLKSFIELENCTLDYDEIKEAEQFLNEVEK